MILSYQGYQFQVTGFPNVAASRISTRPSQGGDSGEGSDNVISVITLTGSVSQPKAGGGAVSSTEVIPSQF